MKDQFDVTTKFLRGLPKKYHEIVESVDRDKEGYLVYLAENWYQADDDITTVWGKTITDARNQVKFNCRKLSDKYEKIGGTRNEGTI